MAIFQLPYGHETCNLCVDDEHLAGVLKSDFENCRARLEGELLVRKALQNPIGSQRLSEMAVGKQMVVVITSDHTRPVPSHITMPLILEEIRCGNPEANITILIAVGLHRSTTKEELCARFGERIVAEEKIVIHNCDDPDNLVSVGTLPSGGELIVNRLATEADLLIADGFIEPHFFAGFSGGRKSILPGIAGRSTVMYNHNAEFIASPRARSGVLDGNPINEDMEFAARAVGLDFIVNTVIDFHHKPIYAVAGDCILAHREGCAFLAEKCSVKAVLSDIVITTNGGYPLDQNIYQAVKGMTAAEASVVDGGVIVMVAQAIDGHGGRSFHDTFLREKDLSILMRGILNREREETIVDQWESQILARVLMKARVVFVSECDDDLVRDFHMIPAHTIQEGLEKAIALVDKEDYRVVVIPNGVSVIVQEISSIACP